MTTDIQDQILYKLGSIDAKLDAVKETIESHEPRIAQLEQARASQGTRNAITAGGLGIIAGGLVEFLIKLWPTNSH